MPIDSIKLDHTSRREFWLNGQGSYVMLALPRVDNPYLIEVGVCPEGVFAANLMRPEVLEDAYPSLLGKYLLPTHPIEGMQQYYADMAYGQCIGTSFDTNPETGLKEVMGLFWVWPEKVPKSILDRWNQGERVPVSSGHIAALEKALGEAYGKTYNQDTISMYFDHVAVVSVGACSVAEGCDSHVLQAQRGIDMSGCNQKKKFQTVIIQDPNKGTLVNQGLTFDGPDKLLEFIKASDGVSDENIKKAQLDQAMATVAEKIIDYMAMLVNDEGQTDNEQLFLELIAKIWGDGDIDLSAEVPAAGGNQAPPAATPAGQVNPTPGTTMMSKKGEGVNMAQAKKGAVKFPVPQITLKEGKLEIAFVGVESEEEARTKITELITGYNEQLTGLSGEVGVVREHLLTALRAKQPNLSDKSLETYNKMDISSLRQIVADMGGLDIPGLQTTTEETNVTEEGAEVISPAQIMQAQKAKAVAMAKKGKVVLQSAKTGDEGKNTKPAFGDYLAAAKKKGFI